MQKNNEAESEVREMDAVKVILEEIDKKMAAQSLTEQPELLIKYMKIIIKLLFINCLNPSKAAKRFIAQRIIYEEL